MKFDFEAAGLRELVRDCPDEFLRVQFLHKAKEMSDPSEWFRAVRVMGTPGGPGRFHVTDLSNSLQWNVAYVMRARMSCDDPVSYTFFDKPICLNGNVEAGDSKWDIYQACRDVLEKETNPPEPASEPQVIDTMTIETENGPFELKVATNLKPVEGTTNMHTAPESTEPALERNPYKAFAFMASEDVAEFIREHENTKLISDIISDSREFKLWLEKNKPADPSAVQVIEIDDDRVWELENELMFARRELRRAERECRGYRRQSMILFVSFAIYVAVDVASYFLNN